MPRQPQSSIQIEGDKSLDPHFAGGWKTRLPFLLVLLCFFLSGVAGLSYQTAWTRQFGLVFGTSELALATVLAAYMAGLALGAGCAGRWMDRVRRPVLVYAVLELGIGLSALAVPHAINAARALNVALLGGTDLPLEGSFGSGLIYGVSSFVILLVPTALMGATLPLLARYAVQRETEIGSRVGLLYTANTVGAAAGTLLTAFVLLPHFGLGQTILVAVAINVIVFGLAALLARGFGALKTDPHGLSRGCRQGVAASTPETLRPRGERAATFDWILPLILVSGVVSFSWEILWTRLLSNLFGSSVYAFATMLATFLIGLALGSAVAARLASSPARAWSGFIIAQIAIAGLSLGAFAAVERLPAMAQEFAASGEGFLVSGIMLGAITLLPGAVAMGATFPFAVRILARNANDAARASGRVFAWNTFGAIIGALAAGYLVLPVLRFAGMATAAGAVSLVLALIASLVVRPKRRLSALVALAGLLALVVVQPAMPEAVLRYSPLSSRQLSGEIVHYGVGRSATVLLLKRPTAWRLLTNGLPESAIESRWGRPNRYIVTRWLSLLPLTARPETRSLLVVGLGAGVTVEDVPQSVEEIRVIEIEPEVLRANQRMADRRHKDPLADPRLQVHLNDARGALQLTSRRFGAIVSQPSHPWTAGASHLFTREFFVQVREHLTPNGVFSQWMGLPFVDEALLRSLVATMVDVFPHVELYQPALGTVLLLASVAPLDVSTATAPSLEPAHREWAQIGVLCRQDIAVARILDSEGARRFAKGAAVSTDFHNLFQTRSPQILNRPLGAAGAERVLGPFDPLLTTPEQADLLYFVRRLIRRGEVKRAERLAKVLIDPVKRQTAVGLTDFAAGRARAAELALQRAFRLDPQAEETLAGLLTLHQPGLSRGQSFSFTAQLEGNPAATAVIEGWRLGGESWQGVQLLEAQLREIEVRHPLFVAASRLRVSWRVDSGDAKLAEEALDLLNSLLAPLYQPQDLLLKARAAEAAAKPQLALAAIRDALPRIQRQPVRARQVLLSLGSLSVEDGTVEWRNDLLSQVDRVLL